MNKRDEKLIETFEYIKDDSKIINSTISIQNKINIYANSKIIALVVAQDDISLEITARTMSEVYSLQKQSTLLIDCNMYNPSLSRIFNNPNFEVGLNEIIDETTDANKTINHIHDNLDVVFTKKAIYPTEVFKSNQFMNFINNVKAHYEHIVLVMPALVDHQDILICKNIITAALLVARRNKVSKKDLFDSIQTLESNNIAYVGTIYLK